MSSMSESWIACQPRIDEPSKPSPSSNALSSNARDRQRHVLPRPEQVAELEVDHRRPRLRRPVERLARVRQRLAAVPQVVPLLDLRHRRLLRRTKEKDPRLGWYSAES